MDHDMARLLRRAVRQLLENNTHQPQCMTLRLQPAVFIVAALITTANMQLPSMLLPMTHTTRWHLCTTPYLTTH